MPLREHEVARLRAVVEANAEALREVSEASRKPGVDWKLEFPSPMILAKLPDLTPQRRLARLLAADALLAHHDGDDARALRRLRETLFVSRTLARQPVHISHLVSIGIAGLAVEGACQIAPELRVASAGRADATVELRALIAELLDDRAVHESRKRALRGERASQLDACRAIAAGTFSADREARAPAGAPRQRLAALKAYAMKPLALNDARHLIDLASGIIESGEAADLPSHWAKLPKPPVDLERHFRRHRVAAVLVPSYGGWLLVDYRSLGDRHSAATALAVRWYAVEHSGKLPARLEDLVPKYLPAVPVDPMAAGGKPLVYVTGERPVIYSIGENMRDDGGVEPSPEMSFRDQREKTDRVVHLKRQPRPAPPEEPKDEPAESP